MVQDLAALPCNVIGCGDLAYNDISLSLSMPATLLFSPILPLLLQYPNHLPASITSYLPSLHYPLPPALFTTHYAYPALLSLPSLTQFCFRGFGQLVGQVLVAGQAGMEEEGRRRRRKGQDSSITCHPVKTGWACVLAALYCLDNLL